MKKILSFLLVLILVISLCACGDGETKSEAATGLQVGYCKVDVTPDFEVGLGGYSDAETRTATGVVDHVYTSCIAVTSGEDTILLLTIDTCGLNWTDKQNMRLVLANATKVPKDNIFIGATHGHNCPALSAYPNAQRYTDFLNNKSIEAANFAMEDRSAATLYRTKAEHEGLNFVRHYTLEDGTLVDNSGANGNIDKIIGHPMDADKEMILLKFDRADEKKKDILTVHWQAHPDDASEIGYNMLSPGFIGPLRNKLEKDTGMHVAYFNGASGNLNRKSKYKAEQHDLDFYEYGEKLAQLAAGMLPSLEAVEGTEIKTGRGVLDVPVDHSWDHMLSQANEVYEVWKAEGKEVGDALGEKYDFSSVYQARAIRSRVNLGQTIGMDMGVFSIGDIGFTEGTYEMFSTNAMFVKANSPFETTVVITGNSTYMPAEICYSYRSYESDTGFYAQGAAEMMADEYVAMLKALKTPTEG